MLCRMVPEEDPATDGGGNDGGTGPPKDGPQMGQEEQGTGAPEETRMVLDQQEGLDAEEHSGAVQEPLVGLPPLERRRQLAVVVHHGTYFVACSGAGWHVQQKRGSTDGPRREPTGRLWTTGSTGGARTKQHLPRLYPAQLCTGAKRGRTRGGENPPVQRTNASCRGAPTRESGVGAAATESRPCPTPDRHHGRTVYRKTGKATGRAQNCRVGGTNGQDAISSTGAGATVRNSRATGSPYDSTTPTGRATEQQHPMGTRQAGQPQMATRVTQPQMVTPTYAQVAQGPPRQALPRSAEETRRRQEITHGKRAAEAPQAAGASRVAPRAHAPSSAMGDLQAGQTVPGTSPLSADLRRYVSRLVQQYMAKRIGTLVNARPATDSPVLDMEMVEEDRLAWQQLATGPHLRRAPDEDQPNAG